MTGQRVLRIVAFGAVGIAMSARADIAVAGQQRSIAGLTGVIGIAGGGSAQSGQTVQPTAPRPAQHPPRVVRHRTPPNTNVPFPNIATLSGPLPNGVNLVNPPRDLFRGDSRLTNNGFQFYPFYPGYGGYSYGASDEAGAARPMPSTQTQAANGMLRLEVTPGSAQVFADGFYVGTADDIENRRGLVLPEGPHRIEVRARGYQPNTVDVRVVANDVVTYRATLDMERVPAASSVARGSTTIYVVPGCYMGNVPPRKDRVGAGCDVKQARVITPPAPPASR